MINAGTNFTLNAEITFSDPTVVDVEILLALNWSRDDVLIISNDRISVSSVSTSESGYTAFLTYSPIATSDSGLITATVSVSPSDESMYIQSVAATAVHNLSVHGMTTFMSLEGILYSSICLCLTRMSIQSANEVISEILGMKLYMNHVKIREILRTKQCAHEAINNLT